MFGKQKFKAVFFIKEHSTFRIRKKKRFNPLSPIVKYRSKPYNPILAEPTYIKGITSYYFFDIDGKQITVKDGKKEVKAGKQLDLNLNDNDLEANPKDLLYANEVIKQVFMSLEKRPMILNWIHLVLGIGFALVSGWIIGTYFPIMLVNGG